MGSNNHHRHIAINQRNRAMLHLRCRITFSVDVANLLQLQSSLQGYRILESAAQIDEIASVRKGTAQVSYLIVQLQHFLHLGRNVPELLCNLLVFAFADGTSLLTDGKCQEDENGNLTGECLGRGNTDFRTHVNVGTGICFTGDGRADGITDTIDERTIFLGKLDGCQGISGFTTLGDGDDDIILRYYRIAVTELRCIFHFHRDAAVVLNHLLADESGMP